MTRATASARPGNRRSAGILGLLAHAQRQRLEALEQGPGVERRQARAGMAEIVVQVLVDPFLVGQDDAAKAAALAVNMLGGGIDDDMRAELERLLLQRRGKDIVDDQRAPIALASLATAAMSTTSSVGLVGLSRKNSLVFGRTAFSQLSMSRAIDQRGLDAVSRRQRLDHPAAGAEQGARRDDMVAGPQLAQDRRR